jgi:hypothetical protein
MVSTTLLETEEAIETAQLDESIIMFFGREDSEEF